MGHPRWRRRVWPTNLILTIPSTGATARNKSALSLIRSAIKRLGTHTYGSWQTTNCLLLGRKNEPSDSAQSSSASRFTAGAAGFFDLIQCRERPER